MNDQCTLEEVVSSFGPYFDTRGEHGLVLRQNPKVMLGVNFSDEMNQVLGAINLWETNLPPPDKSRCLSTQITPARSL
ncbi:MAG: hypothetical protein R3C11_27555 [Planctomycetaceae bacterium]